MPAMKVSLPSAQAIDVDFGGVGQIAVDQQRAFLRDHQFGRLVERGGQPRDVAVELGAVAHDLHAAAAQHVGRTDHDRIADLVGDGARRVRRGGDAVLRLAHFELVEQRLEAVAVFGEIDHVGRGAEDRHLGLLQMLGELERGLAAELHDDAMQRAIAAFGIDDLQYVFRRQRLEIEPVGGVVVGRHRFRIAVDHDGLVADFLQREGGVTAAIVEFDTLADAVGTAAENDDLLFVGRRRLIDHRAVKRRLVGRIHISGGRGEFGGAGVDALEHRPHAERAALFHHRLGGIAGELAEAGVGKAHGLEPAEGAGGGRQALGLDLGFGLHQRADLGQEPRIDAAGIVDQLVAGAEPHGLRDLEQAVRRRRAERGADGGLVVGVVDALGRIEALDGDFVEAGEAGLQRAQRLLQALLEGAADRHGFAHRLHRGGEHVRGAGEFLEGKTGNLGDHVIDGRLERGRRGAAGDVVGDFVERVADRQLGGDLGDREARWPWRRARTSATRADSFRSPPAARRPG